MERTIDRTSYRRSVRTNLIKEEPNEKPKRKKIQLLNIFLNQIIVSLLIMIGFLTMQYFEMDSAIDWIKENLSGGYGISELYTKLQNRFEKPSSSFYTYIKSGENVDSSLFFQRISGEENTSGEESSGEKSGEFITAVEGVNQMLEDIRYIKENFDLKAPLQGTITSLFGSRESNNPVVSSYHTGLDIGANSGTDICAAHSGVVTMAKSYSSYGNCVMIENENLVTVYAHCSSIDVKEGQNVQQGDVIAKVGMTGNATGPHLHFEIRYEGRYIDPREIVYE